MGVIFHAVLDQVEEARRTNQGIQSWAMSRKLHGARGIMVNSCHVSGTIGHKIECSAGKRQSIQLRT
jgi:hypothetical protein